ncbi:mediator of RNA polymerase II transcription subunit 24 [Ditylenchus destructor]|nr:mediator of RNA polymerase II transcription subunit 24 [Ditylenchus destructor]
MVVSEQERWFEKLVFDCLKREASVAEFLASLNEHGRNDGAVWTQLPVKCKGIIQFGSGVLCGTSELLLKYLDALWASETIDHEAYVESLTAFERFERNKDVELIKDRLYKFVETARCTYTSEDECALMCQLMFSSVKWMLGGIENLLLGCLISDEIPALAAILRQCTDRFHDRIKDIMESEETEPIIACGKDLKQLSQNIHNLANPPSLSWQPFREDFIYKELRPAILTLGSIFATFRVLRSDEEIANSFLVVGKVLGMTHPQIVFDVLRSGFLIQLETIANQAEHRDREALSDMFVYLKLPQILLKLVEQGVSREDILNALEKISQNSTLLNELDLKKRDNTFIYVVEQLVTLKVLDEKHISTLKSNRRRGIEQNLKLFDILQSESARTGVHQSRIQHMQLSQKAKKSFEKTINQDLRKWIVMITRLMQSAEQTVDTICSVFCADGDLSSFSAKLASINYQTERLEANDAEDQKNRVLMFDATFLLLARIHYVYMDLRLEYLVGENTSGIFHDWTKRYDHCLHTGEPMPVDPHLKQNFMGQIGLMKNGQTFWNDSWDFADLIGHVPLIGDIILDEYKKEHHNDNEIQNILSTFNHMSCLMLCLVQWLETQPQSAARQVFAKTLTNFSNTRAQECSERLRKVNEPSDGLRKESSLQDSSDHRWMYTILVIKKGLKQLAEGRRQKEQPYTWVINFAHRQLPTIYQTEVPDLQMLKEAFLFANQQSWASPDVIAHIDRCNKNFQQSMWCKCWMMQMLKSWTSDEMEISSELCLSAALTDPAPCLLEIIRQLVEYVLYDGSLTGKDASFSSASSSSTAAHHYNYVNIAINKTSATVLAKMLVRSLILLLWAEERRQIRVQQKTQRYGPPRKRKYGDHETDTTKDEFGRRSEKHLSGALNTDDITKEQARSTKDEAKDREDGESASTSAADSSTDATDNQRSFKSRNKDPVRTTIVLVFERFDKLIKGASLRPPVTFIIFFIHELAKAPRTVYWRRLVEMIPINLIFAIARLDTSAIPLSMFLQLYDIKEDKNRVRCLKYTCMMRKFGQI